MFYLDWAATALPDSRVMRHMAEKAVEFYANPSSPYPVGKAAKEALEEARSRAALVLGCDASQLAFTSGGTEANAIVLFSQLLKREPGTLLISGIEHPSVAEPAALLRLKGWTVKTLETAPDGILKPNTVSDALKRNPDTRLLAVMGVNNEIGAIQPLFELSVLLREFQEKWSGRRAVSFHTDLVQAVGKIPVNLASLDVDTASFSAHKFQGPRGVGLLYHRNRAFEALARGGGQEHGVRPGTENVAGAMAMALALELHGRPHPTINENGHWLLEQLERFPKATIIPKERKSLPQNYVPGIIAVSFPPIPGEVLVRVLAEAGYAVSTGSACSSNKKGKLSKTMIAMNVPKNIAAGMIRISIGELTSRDKLEGFLEALETALKALDL